MVEITSEEQKKVKSVKRTEDSLRDLWDNIKHTNIQIIRQRMIINEIKEVYTWDSPGGCGREDFLE